MALARKGHFAWLPRSIGAFVSAGLTGRADREVLPGLLGQAGGSAACPAAAQHNRMSDPDTHLTYPRLNPNAPGRLFPLAHLQETFSKAQNVAHPLTWFRIPQNSLVEYR